jgi:hypothetical protein
MSSEVMNQILETIETEVNSRSSSIEFEMAYQMRVATERIRFAIRQAEQYGPKTDPMREIGVQLLDALERLESVDRKFQLRSRHLSRPNRTIPESNNRTANGTNREAHL